MWRFRHRGMADGSGAASKFPAKAAEVIQVRPDGEGVPGALVPGTAVELGWPDLIAAITTAQAKNSRSSS